MANSTVASTVRFDVKGILSPVASGKVRELYEVDDSTLLVVASDRVSAYDCVMKTVSLFSGMMKGLQINCC